MKPRAALDVSGLPSFALGKRDPLFWGVLCMIAIEGTVFALLIMSYFYIRGNLLQVPPAGENPPPILIPTVGVVLLLITVVPTHFMNKAAVRGDLRAMRRMLIALVLLGLAFLVCRFWEVHALPFTWKSHAYGSAFWALLMMHSVHGIAGTVENALFTVLLFRGPVEQKHRTDIQMNGIYWYFVVFSWVVIYAILYLDPGVLHGRIG